jgi:hypothetical protein
MDLMLINNEELEDSVVCYVRDAAGFVPFHLLIADLSECYGIDYSGNVGIDDPRNPNHVVWPYFHPALADAIVSAVRKGSVYLVPALAEQYRRTGIDLRDHGFVVPVSEEEVKNGDGPFWLPMTLSSEPLHVKPPPFLADAVGAELPA